MSVLFYGTILFLTAFFIHLLIWKLHLPVHQKSILILLFGAALAAGVAILFLYKNTIIFLGVIPPQTFFEYAQLCIFFISLWLAYMVTYSALEADSPSLVMVMAIAKAKNGLEKEIFDQQMSNEVLLIPRINDLISEKLAYVEDGKYKLTPKGMTFARLFSMYRKLLKRNPKGG